MVVAVFGTTISPYLFFWQAAQEVEDLKAVSARNGGGNLLPHAEAVARQHLRRIRWDTYLGMGFSNLIAFFIILGTAATLHAAGITHIETAGQAAEALRPIGGPATFLLFSLGIIGTGMLAVPVLAGSAAYAVAESFEWSSGLDAKVHEAREFYGIVAIATIGGVILNFLHLDPMRALVWSAEINGVIAIPIMAVMMMLGGPTRHHGAVRHSAEVARPGLDGDRSDDGQRAGDVRYGLDSRVTFVSRGTRRRHSTAPSHPARAWRGRRGMRWPEGACR